MIKSKKLKLWLFAGLAIMLVCAFALMPKVNVEISFGERECVFTVGFDDEVYAATPDYTVDGTADDVQVQQAVDDLPSTGGKVILYGGNYNFTATVARAIDNITIEGSGISTYIAYNGSTEVFSAGSQSGWIFSQFRTDAGWINVASASSYAIINCSNNGTLTTYLSGVTVLGNNITLSGTVDGRDLSTDGTKLDGIEASADVTDSTNVDAAGATMNADTSLSGNSYFLDEDNMASDSATKVASQQSIKAYVDAGAGAGCRVYMSGNQTVSHETDTTIQFDTESHDITSEWNTGTYRFVPSTAGYYVCFVKTRWTASLVNGLGIRKNGTITAWSEITNRGNQISDTIYLNGTGDYIDFYAWQNTGSDKTLDGGVAWETFAYINRAGRG